MNDPIETWCRSALQSVPDRSLTPPEPDPVPDFDCYDEQMVRDAFSADESQERLVPILAELMQMETFMEGQTFQSIRESLRELHKAMKELYEEGSW